MSSCLKESVKFLARGIARLCVLPLVAVYRLNLLCSRQERLLSGYSQLMAQFPGLSGVYLRREFYRLTLKFCADNCYIGYGTIFSGPDVEIRSNVYIGAYCIVGSAIIEEQTLIASRVSIISGVKQHRRESDGTFAEYNSPQQIRIGKSCWIGEGAIVGADIGAGSNVAAGAVVLKSIAEKVSVFGNPARTVALVDSSVEKLG